MHNIQIQCEPANHAYIYLHATPRPRQCHTHTPQNTNTHRYDATPLMQALREGFGPVAEARMVDASLETDTCHTAIVSAVCSTRPLRPFIFRTYQLPPGVDSSFVGSCKYQWLEAMRASSAAPYFFEEVRVFRVFFCAY